MLWLKDCGGGIRKDAVNSITLQAESHGTKKERRFSLPGNASHYWGADLIAIACEKLFTI